MDTSEYEPMFNPAVFGCTCIVLHLLAIASKAQDPYGRNGNGTVEQPKALSNTSRTLTGFVCNVTEEVEVNVTKMVTAVCTYTIYKTCRKSKICSRTRRRPCQRMEYGTDRRNESIAVCCEDWTQDDNGSCVIPVCRPSCEEETENCVRNGSRNICIPIHPGTSHVGNTPEPCEVTCPVDSLCVTNDNQTRCTCADKCNGTTSPPVLSRTADNKYTMNVWIWVAVAVVLFLVLLVIVILVVYRWKKRPPSITRHMSRFSESFRRRLGKEGISNPVFVVDNVRMTNARTLPRAAETTQSVSGQGQPSHGTASSLLDDKFGVYDMASSQEDINSSGKNATIGSSENYYVEHEPTGQTLHASVPSKRPTHIQHNNETSERRLRKVDVNRQVSEDYYEPVVHEQELYDTPKSYTIEVNGDNPKSHVPQVNYATPKPLLQHVNYDTPKPSVLISKPAPAPQHLPPTPQPSKKAPELKKLQPSKKRKKSRRNKQPVVYGNVESNPADQQRESTGAFSEDGRSSGEVYMNVQGARYMQNRPHVAVFENEDTYDFAPGTDTTVDGVYVGHSPGSTLSAGQSPGGAMAGHNDNSASDSDDSNIYQSVDEDEYDYLENDMVIGTNIENPLFGLKEEPEDFYENDGDEVGLEQWRAVALGSDHIYDTIA